MLKKLIVVGVFCAIFLTQVLMGVADAAPKMAQKESVIQESMAPEAAAGSVMQATGFTYVYGSASTGSAKLLALGTGNKVRVLKDCGSWTKVDAAGRAGYVQTRYLATSGGASVAAKTSAGSVTEATGFTYVYRSATTGSTRLLALGAGNKVRVLKNCGSWTQVNAAGKTGYVQTRYLKTSGSSSKTATSTAVKAGTVMQATGFTYVYRSASTGSTRLLALGAGNKVQVKKILGSWMQVNAAGRTGYVQTRYLKTSGGSSKTATSTAVKAGTVMQAKGFTYVYRSATTGSTRLLALGAGNKVQVKKDGGTWMQVIAAGKTGYVKSAYLTASKSTVSSGSSSSSSSSTSIKAGAVAQAIRVTYVRASASPYGSKLITLGVGNKVDVKKVSGSWTQVKAAGKVGYTYTADLKPSTSSSSGSSAAPSSSVTKATIYTDRVSENVIRIKLTSYNGKKLKVMISKGSQTVYYNLLSTTSYQTFPLNMGTGSYKVSVLENISGTSYKYITSKTVTVSGTSTSAYLISTSEVNFNSSMAPVQLAATLTSGKTTSQKVQAVYTWVINNIDYDHGKNPPAGYVPSIVSTYNEREGICYDFSALFAAMLRSQGVPTKLVKGYADGVSGYHAWNEVYVNGTWYTVDTSYDAQVHGSMYKYSGYHKTSES